MDNENSNLQTAVAVPGLQSLISSVWALLVIGLLSWAVWGVFSLWVGILAGLVGSLVWFAFLLRWHRLTGLQPEPEYKPNPEPEPIRAVRVEVIEHEGMAGKYITLPVREDQLTQFSLGVLAGMTISESAWSGSGRPFSRDEFRQLREEMIRRGLLRWVNEYAHSQGIELSPAGKAVLRYFAGLPSPTHARENQIIDVS